jgi:TonB family protein
VTDQTGGVLPGVDVRATLRDNSGETTRRVVTNGAGTYDLDNLAPGAWVVTTNLPGFEASTRRVEVQAGEALDWSPVLQIGSVQETVTIITGTSREAERDNTPAPQVAPPIPLPPPAPLAAPRPGLVRVGGSIKPPRKLVNVNPVYPSDAAATGIGGVVILSAVIGPDGLIRDISTLRSPDDSLTLAATGALNGWQFSPTLLNGTPVATRMTATFNFKQQF